MFQHTLASSASLSGASLHTGEQVTLTLRPAPLGHGRKFRRMDLPEQPLIDAAVAHVKTVERATTLGEGSLKVHTVEHILSALAGLGVDNALIEMTANEPPIGDGSAAPFVFLLQGAGIEVQAAPKRFIRINSPIEVRDGDKWARLEPHNGYRLAFSIAFDHPVIDRSAQSVTIDFAQTSYMKEIARARTFGFMQDVENLREHGLALGGGLDNAVVLDEYRVLNSEGLRFTDEFIRHKVLDAIGDLYLIGHPILGAFSAHKSGHALNNQLLRAVLAAQAAWEIVTFESPSQAAPAGILGEPVAA
ncbi:MAG: UDP-3-O-acyl-N-acetylglucosamine deacetylase [Proteobacteria bacterium]|nr:UDP-3-O-acyl-N-acetylglucosamine deacetylase [Pseudomonadota bacterium]